MEIPAKAFLGERTILPERSISQKNNPSNNYPNNLHLHDRKHRRGKRP